MIGAVAGLYPSMRAARLSPTEALRTVVAGAERLGYGVVDSVNVTFAL